MKKENPTFKDETGNRYGLLTVLKQVDSIKHGDKVKARWLCICDCGNSCLANAQLLRNGHKKSCGCLKHKDSWNRSTDEIGKKYGILTVIASLPTKHNKSRWTCRCECGKEKTVTTNKLHSGIFSCGCQRFVSQEVLDSRTISAKYAMYKHAANKRGYSFEINKEEFKNLLQNECVYCGLTPAVGVDRKDNSIGYTFENSVSCCNWCNRMKLDKSCEDFIEHCKRIINNHKLTPVS